MTKTKIPWCDYTINPVKGLCPVACEYCYARAMYKRFKWNPEVRLDRNAMTDFPSKASRIFIGSTMELFGDWVKPEWMEQIIALLHNFPQHTFIFLTKQPQNLPHEWPDNCWVGVSVTNQEMLSKAIDNLQPVLARVKFLSFEPLLDKTWARGHEFARGGVDWVIIGSRTQPTRHPPHEWVDEIIDTAEETCCPVFVKEPLASYLNLHRQEFPK